MIVTIRSSSSEVMSPALRISFSLDDCSNKAGLKTSFLCQGDKGIPLVEIYVGLFAHQIGVAAPNTLDFGQGVHDLLLAIHVGVEEAEDELEVRLLPGDERCLDA